MSINRESSSLTTGEVEGEPARCSPFAHWLGRLVMYLAGWSVKATRPQYKKMVILGFPHTSAWDLIFLLATAYCMKMRVNFVAKKALFFPVFGRFLRYLGGIPITRGEKKDTVDQLVAQMEDMPKVSLVIAPEGTRARTDYWKSGFYHIASAAGIPIVCGYLDYAKKEAGLGPVFIPTDDLTADMNLLRGFYEPISACYPEQKGEIRLREESPINSPGDRHDQ